MLTFADAITVKEVSNLSANFSDDKIAGYIKKAGIEIREIISNEKYNLYLQYQNNPDESLRNIYFELETAETYLTIGIMLPLLNISNEGAGFFKIRGWDQTRQELYSMTEIIKLANQYRSAAYKMVSKYAAGTSNLLTITNNNFTMTAL